MNALHANHICTHDAHGSRLKSSVYTYALDVCACSYHQSFVHMQPMQGVFKNVLNYAVAAHM